MNQIKTGALLSYVNLGINVLIGLVYTPWMIRSIGQDDYGLYTLAMSIIGLLAFDFGLGNATTKFVCEYLALKRQDKVDELLGIVYKLYLMIDIIIALIFIAVYVFLPQIYEGLSHDELHAFKGIFILAAVYCVLSFPFIPVNGLLSGYEKFVPLKLCDLFQRIFIVVTMSVCLIKGYGLFALVLVNSISGILCILLKLYFIRRDTPLRIEWKFWNKQELYRILSFVIWVTIIALASRCIYNIAPSIVGMYTDAAQIAILGIAITIESYTFFFTNALGGLFLPRVSRLVATQDIRSILKLMIKVGRLECYICMFVLLWFIFYGTDFIDLWVGARYHSAGIYSILFIVPMVLQVPHEIGMQYIIAANKLKIQSIIYAFMASINLALAFSLTKFCGVMGIAIAISISCIVRTILLDIYFKKIGIDIAIFYKKCFGVFILPFLIVALAFYFIGFIAVDGWIGLIMKSIFAVIVYLFCIVVLCANNDELSLLKIR